MRRQLMAIPLGVVLLFSLVGLGQGQGVGIVKITDFDAAAFELPEGLAIDARGNMYVAMAPTGEIKRVTPDGTVSTFARLPAPEGEGPVLAGLRFSDAGELYAALGSHRPGTQGIWRISADGARQELFAPMELDTLPNDIQFWNGELYVSESIFGNIWKFTRQGQAILWKADPLMVGDPDFVVVFPSAPTG